MLAKELFNTEGTEKTGTLRHGHARRPRIDVVSASESAFSSTRETGKQIPRGVYPERKQIPRSGFWSPVYSTGVPRPDFALHHTVQASLGMTRSE